MLHSINHYTYFIIYGTDPTTGIIASIASAQTFKDAAMLYKKLIKSNRFVNLQVFGLYVMPEGQKWIRVTILFVK